MGDTGSYKEQQEGNTEDEDQECCMLSWEYKERSGIERKKGIFS